MSIRFLSLIPALLLLTACSSTPALRESAHMYKGKRYLDRGEFKKASIEFRVASQNMPKDAEPLYQLGMTYLRAGTSQLALESFQKAVAVDPKHEEAQYQLALFKVSANKPELLLEAKQVLLARAASHPNDAEAFGTMAMVEVKLDNKEQSLKWLLEFAEKKPASYRPANLTIAVFMARQDVESAKEFSSALAKHVPDSPDAAVLRAEVLLATHDDAGADAEINRALSLKPDLRPALMLRLRRQEITSDPKGAEQTSASLSKLPEQQWWSAHARVLFSQKKYDEGIAEYQRALKEHGNAVSLRGEYAASLIAAGRSKDAIAVVGETLKDHPKDPTALLQRATLEISTGSLDAATRDIKTLRDMKRVTAELSVQESRIYAARGETVKEGDLLTEALQQAPRFSAARNKLVQLLIASGKARNALLILDQAPGSEKSTPEYLYYRNSALLSAGEWEEARKGVDAALKQKRTPGFLYQDAALRVHAKELAGARKSIEAGLELAPADPFGWKLLGEAMQDQGQLPAFVGKLKEAVARNPGAAPLEKLLSARLTQTGDLSGARAAYEAAKIAGDAEADREVAVLDIRTGSVDSAERRMLEPVKTHDSAASRLVLGDIALRKGATDLAIQHYTQALKLEPANPAVMNNLAEMLAVKGRYDDALFWAQKALALSPGNPTVLDTIGWTYYRQGKFEPALEYLDKALRGRERPLAHYHFAAGLLKAGDPARAKAEYAIALRQDPQSPARTEVAQLFEGSIRKVSR